MIKHFSLKLEQETIKNNWQEETTQQEEQKDLTLSFIAISNHPIKRKFYDEEFYVTIDTKSFSFDAKTFFTDHEISFRSAIGKIISSKFEDGNIKVKVQFFKDIEDSYTAFKKFKNGMIDSVSIGIGDCEVEESGELDGLKHYTYKNGDIIELSAVWQGADPRAKIAEFKKTRGENMAEKKEFLQEEKPQTQGESMLSSEEIQEIKNLAEKTNKIQEGLDAIAQNIKPKDFAMSLLDKQEINIKRKENIMNNDLDFSLSNLVKNAFGSNEGKINFMQGNNGYIIPNDFYKRFEKNTTEHNTSIIHNNLRTDKFIEQVFIESNLLSKCDILSGLNGTLRIPKDASEINAYWVKEGGVTPESNIRTQEIALTPYTIKSKVKITRQMLGMSAISLESFIINSLKNSIKLRLEADLLYGEGIDNSPIKGIMSLDGVNVINGYFTQPDYKKTLEFSGKISEQNLNISDCFFVANSKAMTQLQTTPLDKQSTNIYLLNQSRDYLCGYNFIMNNHLKDNHMIFGDFKNVLIGTWSSLQVIATRDDEGDVTLTGFYDVGMAVKRENAFVIAKS
ncbi:phage major capsid protein [Helicobacter sp. faydin-H20]|uniref:phage major capsid protein n=1 Tax=Helicobacter anatolicus TaxID=2905874 RepID=UPI001E3A3F40|nr:phage major capsid protein [Helicobacter anatolicus]MCE3037503.1 phage major capsid protein [Helicobacter anatolicus]